MKARPLIALLILVTLPACRPVTPAEPTATPAATPQAPPPLNRYRIVTPLDLVTLDPALANGIDDRWIAATLIFDQLYAYDAAGALQPDLATALPEAVDALTYRLTLKPNTRFHDGSAVTAEDARFSLLRALDPETGSWGAPYLADVIERVDAPDARTLVLKLKRPEAGLAHLLTLSALSVVPAAALRSAGEAWGKRVAIGSGPFAVSEWMPGERLSLQRHRAWREAEGPLIDGVDITLNTVALVAMERWEKGEADFVWFGSGTAEAPKILSDARFVNDLRRTPGDATLRIAFNPANANAANSALRDAIAQAVDRAAIARFQPGFEPATTLLPEDAQPPPAAAPATAHALLASAGITTPLRIRALSLESAEMTQALGEQLGAAGIEVEWIRAKGGLDDTSESKPNDTLFVFLTVAFPTRYIPHWLGALGVCSPAAQSSTARCDADMPPLLAALDRALAESPTDEARIAGALDPIEDRHWWITLARQTHYGLGAARFSGDVLDPLYGLPRLEDARLAVK